MQSNPSTSKKRVAKNQREQAKAVTSNFVVFTFWCSGNFAVPLVLGVSPAKRCVYSEAFKTMQLLSLRESLATTLQEKKQQQAPILGFAIQAITS